MVPASIRARIPAVAASAPADRAQCVRAACDREVQAAHPAEQHGGDLALAHGYTGDVEQGPRLAVERVQLARKQLGKAGAVVNGILYEEEFLFSGASLIRDGNDLDYIPIWSLYTQLKGGVVQTAADTRLVEAARIYAYRLWELAASLGSTSVMGPENFRQVAELIRDARYNMIIEMRAELGLGSYPRGGGGNPFAGTDLEEKYANAPRLRPGPLTLSQGGPMEPE